MLIDHAAITHLGRVRKKNEDGFLLSSLDGEEPLVNALRPLRQTRPNGFLAAVADGMGGAAAGEIASREGLAALAVNLFGHWGRLPAAAAVEADLLRALRYAADAASRAVRRYAEVEQHSRGMGSTLTAAVIWNGHAYLVQVGDSRAYLFRAGRLATLTEDQTLVREWLNQGAITAEEAHLHPQRNVITQALGGPDPIRTPLGKATLRRHDRLLLCTDGLHGELGDARIAFFLGQQLGAQETLERMLEEALARGGRDNITGLLLDLHDEAFPLALADEPVRVVAPVPPEPAPLHTGALARLGRFLGRNVP
jgi:protein phosphatase